MSIGGLKLKPRRRRRRRRRRKMNGSIDRVKESGEILNLKLTPCFL